MRRLVLVLLILAGAAGFGASSLWADAIEEVEGSGLELRSEPAGAVVYVDGLKRGTTTLVLDTLAAGEYQILLTRDGYLSRSFKVTVVEGKRLVVTAELEEELGKVYVRVDRAPGAPGPDILALEPELYADGESVDGPYIALRSGLHTIRVRAFAWEDASRSVLVSRGSLSTLEFALRPGVFRVTDASLLRRRFNPGNPGLLGTTEFFFEVSAPGTATLSVADAAGVEVFSHPFDPFDTWEQSVAWDGRVSGASASSGRPLPDGVYTARLQAVSLPWDGSEPVADGFELRVAIDSTLHIRPAALTQGSGGLLLTPTAEPLPARSFQIDGNLLFGRPYGSETAWETVPYALGFRVAPADGWELAGALDLLPGAGGDAVPGFGGSIKKVLSGSSGGPGLASALSLGYAWARTGALNAFGVRPGLSAGVPLTWAPLAELAFTLSPALLWTGADGYPQEALPRAVLGGGLAVRLPLLIAGVSVRSEYRFDQDEAVSAGPVLLGAELRFFPPPSVFVLSLLGGAWIDDGEPRPFGGVGFGILH